MTWGNRGSDGCDKSDKALERAKRGQRLAGILIMSNVLLAALVIWRMQYSGQAFPLFVLSYTLILSLSFALSFLEMCGRFFLCLGGGLSSPHPKIEMETAATKTSLGEFVCGDVSDFTMVGNDDDAEILAEKSKADGPTTLAPSLSKQISDVEMKDVSDFSRQQSDHPERRIYSPPNVPFGSNVERDQKDLTDDEAE